MNDGGKARSARTVGSSKSSKSGSHEFGLAIARVSAAQICDAAGFASSHCSALDTFADIIIRYIRELGKASRFYAELSGRADCNVVDVIQGLEDLGFPSGFTGAADVDRCLFKSGVVKEIMQFVRLEDEVPFARSIPRFPIVHPRKPVLSCDERGETSWGRHVDDLQKPMPSSDERGETSRGRHIPNWLPPFPDPHTYIYTPVWHGKKNSQAAKLDQACHQRKQKKSILLLQDRLDLCNGTPWLASNNDDIGGMSKQAVPINPFLEPPVQFGERQVSQISFPDEPVVGNRSSLLESFAPAIQAATNGTFDHGVDDKRILPSKRPTVHFKFGIDKKCLFAPSLSQAVDRKADSCFLKDEKDDKKRRAEMILKKAIENPHELTQL